MIGGGAGGPALDGVRGVVRCRHWVIAAVAERVAAQQAPGGERRSLEDAIAPDRLDRILGAARVILATAGEGGGDPALVSADRGDHQRSHVVPPSPSTSSASAPRMPPVPSRSASSRAAGRATTT